MDPWQLTTIALATFIVLAGLWASGILPSLAGTAGASVAGDYSSVLITFLSNFLPFALFTFGFMSDIVHLEWRASIPSFAGLAAVVLVKLISGFTNLGLTRADNSATSWCTIPGLEPLENPLLPMSFILSSTILVYYLCWTRQPGSPSLNVFAIVTGLVLLIQMVSFSISGNCEDYYYIMSPTLGVAANVLAAIAVGAVVAGIAFGSVSASSFFAGSGDYNPFLRGQPYTGASGPSPNFPSGPKCTDGNTPVRTPSGSLGCKTNSLVCPDGSKPTREGALLFCPPPLVINQSSAQPTVGADGDIFVLADLYKNGQPVTQSISN